jgi:hypothetical protein
MTTVDASPVAHHGKAAVPDDHRGPMLIDCGPG